MDNTATNTSTTAKNPTTATPAGIIRSLRLRKFHALTAAACRITPPTSGSPQNRGNLQSDDPGNGNQRRNRAQDKA
jgi:hypothetical protein